MDTSPEVSNYYLSYIIENSSTSFLYDKTKQFLVDITHYDIDDIITWLSLAANKHNTIFEMLCKKYEHSQLGGRS